MWKVFFVSILVLSAFNASHLFARGRKREGPTAYEVLASYGFPEGLLPPTVEKSGTDYTLDEDSGAFSLHLQNFCRFTIPDSYEVKYASKIAGNIARGQLDNLSGISVHVFWLWWNINAISINGDDLIFQVGPFSASFPADNFLENPGCAAHAAV